MTIQAEIDSSSNVFVPVYWYRVYKIINIALSSQIPLFSSMLRL